MTIPVSGYLLRNPQPVDLNHRVGAYGGTVRAPDASVGMLHVGVVVPLRIHLMGHSNHLRRAGHLAQEASLAPLTGDLNGSNHFCHSVRFSG